MATSILNSTSEFSAPIISGIHEFIVKLPVLIFALAAGTLAIALIIKLLQFILSLTIVQIGLRDVIVSIVRIFLWLLLAMLALQIYFPNIIVFFTGSIAAVGLALAAGGSTLVADIVAGLFLARDEDFNVGDEIIAGETPTQGVIASMDARRVRLRDAEGVLHVIPNSIVERKEWILVHRRGELNALAQAARNIKEAALEKASLRKAATTARQVRLRSNDQ